MAVYEARFSFPTIESFFSSRRVLFGREIVISYANSLPGNQHFSAGFTAYRGEKRESSSYIGVSGGGLSSAEALKNLSETLRREVDHKKESEPRDFFVELREETPFDASMKRDGEIYVRVKPHESQSGKVRTSVLMRQESKRRTIYSPIFYLQTDSFGEAIASLSRVSLEPELLRDFRLGTQVRGLL